jgi:hypothetical protein
MFPPAHGSSSSHSSGNESPTHSPLGPGFGLAAMLATRSLITVRGKQATNGVTGWIHGTTVQALIDEFEAIPSASYLFEDHRIVAATPGARAKTTAWMCRVNGPIEPRDGRAICAAVTRGQTPMDFEIRADLFLSERPQGIMFTTSDNGAVLAIAATLLRQHAAAALQRRAADIASPDRDVVAALLDRDGMSLRGLETERFPGFLDIGIAGVAREANPATRSVIYDRVTRTWHTD